LINVPQIWLDQSELSAIAVTGPDVPVIPGVRWARLLMLGVSPAEAFGCLCPERNTAHRGVAAECFLSRVVRCHSQAGRPCDLEFYGREQAPPDVLVSHQQRLGALDRRQRRRPGTGERPAGPSRQRRFRLPRQAVPVAHRPHLLAVPPQVLRLEVGVVERLLPDQRRVL